MADAPTTGPADEPAKDTDPATGSAPDTAGTDPDPDLGEKGQRALDRMKAELAKAKADLKALQPLAEKQREAEEASKTEVQKAAEKVAAAEARAAAAELDLRRLKVGAAKGLPPALAARLVGDTEEAMAADADEVLKALGSAGTSTARIPNGSAASGGTGAPGAVSMNDLLRAAAGR